MGVLTGFRCPSPVEPHHVDLLDGHGGGTQGARHQSSLGRRREREHGAVVVGVAVSVQQPHAAAPSSARSKRFDDGGITTLGEVRYAQEGQFGHRPSEAIPVDQWAACP